MHCGFVQKLMDIIAYVYILEVIMDTISKIYT